MVLNRSNIGVAKDNFFLICYLATSRPILGHYREWREPHSTDVNRCVLSIFELKVTHQIRETLQQPRNFGDGDKVNFHQRRAEIGSAEAWSATQDFGRYSTSLPTTTSYNNPTMD